MCVYINIENHLEGNKTVGTWDRNRQGDTITFGYCLNLLKPVWINFQIK